MKKLHSGPTINPKKAALRVSAAALMLGVSHAATVGFHFQANYCSSAGYSGAIVTATAFGIETNSWENLLQMQTGYGCTNCLFNNLSEIIDTTTSANGLNPLPNGSLSLNWGGYAANVSGFGGYDRSAPNYTFSGNGWKPGNEEVYWGFIRDGVNFGPVPGSCDGSPGDNNQPGYNVDITGLKSVFTNTPYVVQLIASSDSLWTLTNAFIIDATANSTQSVVYPSIPTPSDQGGSLTGGGHFPRGIGGGLSIASGAINTDHLQIIGNRAEHGVGFNRASTISGFIITDKPVVTMPPNSVAASGGDTVVLSAYAIGVEPLSYQWRQNGASIPGATTATFSASNITAAVAGAYDLVVTNIYGRTTSSPSVVTIDLITTTHGNNYVQDTNPSGSEHDGYDLGATWLASSLDSGGKNRSGVMQFAGAQKNQIVAPAASTFNSPTGTISFWVRTSGVVSSNSATLFDRSSSTIGSGHGLIILQTADGHIEVQGDHSSFILDSTVTVTNNNWHHIAVVFDQAAANNQLIYIDGVLDNLSGSSGWSWLASQQIELGHSHDSAWDSFNGVLDDVRLYNRPLTDSEIASIASSDAIVDSAALVLRLNFDAGPGAGVTLQWATPDATLQSADFVSGPYTDIPGATSPYATVAKNSKKFYRYHGHTKVTFISNPFLM